MSKYIWWLDWNEMIFKIAKENLKMKILKAGLSWLLFAFFFFFFFKDSLSRCALLLFLMKWANESKAKSKKMTAIAAPNYNQTKKKENCFHFLLQFRCVIFYSFEVSAHSTHPRIKRMNGSLLFFFLSGLEPLNLMNVEFSFKMSIRLVEWSHLNLIRKPSE